MSNFKNGKCKASRGQRDQKASARRVALSMVQAEDDDSMDAELKHRAALRGSRGGVKGDHVTPHKPSSHLWGQG